MKTNPHRGEILAAAVKKTRTKVSELIRRAGVSRGTYYNHIKEKNLPFEVLQMYGKAMRYDFSEEVPKMPKYSIEEPEEFYGPPETFDEALVQIEFWKNKYIKATEKYQQLLEEKAGRV